MNKLLPTDFISCLIYITSTLEFLARPQLRDHTIPRVRFSPNGKELRFKCGESYHLNTSHENKKVLSLFYRKKYF